MKDFVLAIIGTVGIAALAMSMNNDKKEIREDFNPGFGYRFKVDKVVKNNYGSENAIPIDQVPNITCKGNTPAAPFKRSERPLVENYSGKKTIGNGLGARDSTNMPFITPSPNYNQNVNKPSPSLNLPAIIRYNPPSLSNMGVTDDYQCNRSIREDFTTQSSCANPPAPYMNLPEDYVGQNYSATPIPAPVMSKDFKHPFDNIAQDGMIADPFDGKEVMIFDRPMTTTLKVGRFAGRGTRDLIRGDLPCAPNTHQGWFSTPADPTALSKGALQAIGGESESTTTMNKFMEMYGDVSGVGSGVNLADPVSTQYTAYEMTNKAQGVCNNTISVTNF